MMRNCVGCIALSIWAESSAGRLLTQIRRIGFPWSEELVERSLRSTGAAVDAAVSALRDGVAASLAGGTHHAGTNWGEGFCIFQRYRRSR